MAGFLDRGQTPFLEGIVANGVPQEQPSHLTAAWSKAARSLPKHADTSCSCTECFLVQHRPRRVWPCWRLAIGVRDAGLMSAISFDPVVQSEVTDRLRKYRPR